MQLKSTHCLVIAGLTIALSAAIPVPTFARSTPASNTCQATIEIGQGASLTYKFIGTIADRVPPNSPQNPIAQNPIAWINTMTVQRRDRDGRITTLLNQATVQDYESIAPDADYSKLPFTGKFRGKPNDGFRLYGVSAAKHGLYASLRPTNGPAQKMQIVHYLSAGKFVRSTAGQCQTQA